MTEEQIQFLCSMGHHFWWLNPEELSEQPERTLAGVMHRGSVEEWRLMEKLFPPEMICHVLETAVCGEFATWSWEFWRGRYGLKNIPLPSRLPGFPAPSGNPWYISMQHDCEIKDPTDPAQRLAWAINL